MYKLIDCGTYPFFVKKSNKYYHCVYHYNGEHKKYKIQNSYIPNPSEWHRKNQGKVYTNNPDIVHMSVPHRSLWLLQEFGIKVSQNEMIGILTHDGVYDEANTTYLKSYLPERSLRTNLPIIMHHADHMASRIEFENWKYKKKVKPKNDKSKLFDELFGDK